MKTLVFFWIIGGGRREGPFNTWREADAVAVDLGGRVVAGTLRAPKEPLPVKLEGRQEHAHYVLFFPPP